MSFLFKAVVFTIFPLFVSFQAVAQNLKINELMSSNRDFLYDEDGDTPDWIEIYNYGETAVHLSDYYLSDNPAELLKWQFPEMELQPNQPLLVYASGKNRLQIPLFWYSLVDKGDVWQYIIPQEEPPSNWKTLGFDASGWLAGASGIGYGDSDDATFTPINTLSVFMRKTFTLNNIESLESLWLHIDFDDAFVAYLNGTEIARQGIGQAGEVVPFDKKADVSHEAKIVNGQAPDGFDISSFIHLLNEGDNVLAVQVHNIQLTSSDLTAIPIFTAGYSHEIELDEPVSEYVGLSNRYPHANFKLSSLGETVCLSHHVSGVTDSLTYGAIPGGYSLGRNKNNPDDWVLFSNPTPGLANQSSNLSGVVTSKVQFSIKEMFLATSQNLVLSGAGIDEEIHFTLNGNEPTISDPVYSSPIFIGESSIVRARIFKAGYSPGISASRTYLFGSQPTIPVVSVITNPDNLWDTETGIYILGNDYEVEKPHKGANFWQDWEKPASIEMVETNGERLFSMNCGIKIFGGWSRLMEQKSLSVFFRTEYGKPEVKGIQLFESKPNVTKFKSLVLRNSGNDFGFSKMRDGMMTSLVRNLNIDLAAYRPTIFYLNGNYWGIINLREKINEDFLESNYGVKANSIDLLQWNGSIVEGTGENYWSLVAFLEANDLSENTAYETVTREIDVSNFIDYELSEIYFDNRDWPGNNIKYWRPQTDEGKWRWILYDTDFGFGIYNTEAYARNTLEFALETDGPPWPNPPWSTFLLRKLLENETFKHRFINRFADVLNTTFLPDSVIAHIINLSEVIEPEIRQNYEKWWKPSVNIWNSNRQTMIDFASKRPDYVRNHIKTQFSIPGYKKLKISILPTGSGSISLNSLTITDANWEGIYFAGVPVSLTANAFAGYKFRGWMIDGKLVTDKTIELNIDKQTNIRLIFDDSGDDGNSVVFNEINYNSPDDNNAGDWVEVYNWGRFDLDVSGWVFSDSDPEHSFIIAGNTILKSGEYLVLCKSETKFKNVHPNVSNYLGEFDFGLSSSGDAVRLYDKSGQLVDEVIFGAELPWPQEPNGGGQTLELRHYYNDNSAAGHWKSSLVVLGTPGRENSVTTNSDWLTYNFQEKQLKVYPNPFSNETRITVKNNYEAFTVQIYTIDGRIVCNETEAGNEFVWRGESTSGQKLQPGIYICKVQIGSEIFTSKIILSK